MSGVRHLYVHLPFCVHRCGYCDFVTVVGRRDEHRGYVDALGAELALERGLLAPALDTVYLGGGTPSFTAPDELARLLHLLPRSPETTVEANPETVTPDLARLLAWLGVTRVSLGAQTFQAPLLAVLERRTTPDQVRAAVETLREGGIANVSLDLVYGIPGQRPDDLERDLEAIVELAPEHVSAYELEAKAGTRFTHAHGAELGRQAEAMEGYAERVVEALESAGYRWYETASFCLPRDARGTVRDLRSRHNLAYWLGRDYLGLGIGAVSTVAGRRWRTAPSLPGYVEALAAGRPAQRKVEELPAATRARERLMLGLRLDEPLPLADVAGAVDDGALRRLAEQGLVERGDGWIRLARRARLLGGAVTAELLADDPEQG
ncbi:MAG: radical SAM family heme chaperone HemW [Thermoleophilia bacterium]